MKVKTSVARSGLMARVRQKGTAPELVVRRILRERGYKFSVNGRSLPGSPDVVSRKAKLAIFVHGCFWHRHAACPYSTTPKTNVQFWEEKFEKNCLRDTEKAKQLRALGYRVVTIWACQLNNSYGLRRVKQRLARVFRDA
jgi:DNA mismatch endonuclease (patch repair protein)